MSTPLVSIVVPCYNQAKYLRETVENALKSTYRPIEILIINDGSKDNSLELAHQLAQEHPEIRVLDQPNGGVSVARNNGINSAKGEIILPLDGDDLIAPNYMEEAVNVLTTRPEVRVVYCKGIKFDENGQKKWKLKPFSLYNLARDNMIFPATFFRRKDALEVGGFSDDMTMGREDWEFWIKMLKNGGEVVQLPFIGYFYRLTPTSKRKKTATHQKKIERLAYLNSKHRDFFERELNGPLRIQRTWSKPYNTLMRWLGLL
ncbi:glycosyltransferase family 2 protein [Algoriphagus aestuariicola]|jgi:glycosyltransferase involved in cell wall biosynthesis|uniref:Glycosyltransferase family 2 protein n=1 Tax=Algoriphagus aestuariicola TaxID=1852016 RepID=A0ABS3BWH4_9BACT|nr:glycosyltransferase family A protein [Algoriphagus aestuariicola]MBN7803642.1 glycosyltransferase family 2 protein [Algoriphagus aestuariicola]